MLTMRQRLPDDAGYDLHSAEAGHIWPGREFEASALVPGCERLDGAPAETAPDSAETAQETPADPPVADDPPAPPTDGTGPQDATEAKDTGRAPGRKPARTKEPRP